MLGEKAQNIMTGNMRKQSAAIKKQLIEDKSDAKNMLQSQQMA